MNQFQNLKWFRNFVAKMDLFGLLPNWTFFAPNPGVSDYFLLYRVKFSDGKISEYKNISLRNKRIVNAIWNPYKRRQKALNDFVQELRSYINEIHSNGRDPATIKISHGYIALLHYCSALCHSINNKDSIQFTILESFGHFETQKPKLVLNSDFHKL